MPLLLITLFFKNENALTKKTPLHVLHNSFTEVQDLKKALNLKTDVSKCQYVLDSQSLPHQEVSFEKKII